MTDHDLQKLAALWREAGASSPEFEQAARRARWRGRLVAYFEVAFFGLLLGGSVFAALTGPGPATTGAGIVLVIGTTWMMWKRRTFRHLKRTLDTSDAEAFLASSIRNTRENLRRSSVSLIAFPLLVPVAVLGKIAYRTGSDIRDPIGVLTAWAQSTRGIVTLCVLSLVFVFAILSRLKVKRELERLEQVRQAYAEQSMHERSGGEPADPGEA